MSHAPTVLAGVVLVIWGVALNVQSLFPSRAAGAGLPAPAPVAHAELEQLTRNLGLGHRLLARSVRSTYVVDDSSVAAAAQLYQLSPFRIPPRFSSPAAPLLEVEQLLERIDRISERAGAWRPRRSGSNGRA